MQVRITTSIASATWSYSAGQVVDIGTSFTTSAIPADVAEKWLASGLAERTGDDETATLKRKKK